jgi:hypothetical protein
MHDEKTITVGELEKFLKDKPKDLPVYLQWEGVAMPLKHNLYFEQEEAPCRIVLSKSLFKTNF